MHWLNVLDLETSNIIAERRNSRRWDLTDDCIRVKYKLYLQELVFRLLFEMLFGFAKESNEHPFNLFWNYLLCAFLINFIFWFNKQQYIPPNNSTSHQTTVHPTKQQCIPPNNSASHQTTVHPSKQQYIPPNNTTSHQKTVHHTKRPYITPNNSTSHQTTNPTKYQSMDHILFHCESTKANREELTKKIGTRPTSKPDLITKYQKDFSAFVESIDFDTLQQSAQ